MVLTMLALRMAHAHTIADEDYKELVRQMHALPAKVRQHTSAYVSIPQHTSAYVSRGLQELVRQMHALPAKVLL